MRPKSEKVWAEAAKTSGRREIFRAEISRGGAKNGNDLEMGLAARKRTQSLASVMLRGVIINEIFKD